MSQSLAAEPPRSAFLSRPALALMTLALLAWLPFINQAFTVDDTNFLALAAHALGHPLKLYDFSINWLGEDQRAFDILANPPLVPWYLAMVSRVADGREWIFHLSYWPFLVLTLAGAYRLGRRFAHEQGPLWTMIWTIVAPGLMVTAHTITPDLPLLGCYVLGIALTIDAFDRDHASFALGGGLLAGISAVCRYSGLTAIPLLLLYACVNRVRFRVAAPAVAAAALPFAAWTIASHEVYGRVHWLVATGFETQTLSLQSVATKSVYQFSSLALVIAVGPLLALLLGRALPERAYRGALTGVVTALALGLLPLSTNRPFVMRETLLLAIGLAGATVIGAVLTRSAAGFRRAHEGRGPEADGLFLACWLVGILVFNLCLSFASVRYLLPALLPTILLFQRASPRPGLPSAFPDRGWLAAAISLALAMVLSAADQRYAGIYRSYAGALPKAAQHRWFTGHWGLQKYLEDKGARTLSSTSPVEPGDEIVTSLTPWPQAVAPEIELELVERREFVGYPGVRTVTYDGRGCFHGNGVARGPYSAWVVGLPFGISNEALDVLTRWRVVAAPPHDPPR